MLAMLEICSIFVLRVAMMLVPSLYPHMPVRSFMARRITFMATKNRMGPIIRPSWARDAPMVANSGARQNWARESPIPANGPMRAILIFRISLEGVLFSSMTR